MSTGDQRARGGQGWRPWAFAALGLAWSACGSEAPPDPCEERLDRLEGELRSAAAGLAPPEAPPDVPLTRVTSGGPPNRLPLLVVSEAEVRFEGRGVGGTAGDQLEAAASNLERDLRARSGDEPLEVGLWVAPEVEVGTLVSLLRSAPPSLRFVPLGRGPEPSASSTPEWVRDALAEPSSSEDWDDSDPRASEVRVPAAERRRRASRAWPRAIRSCAAVGDAFSYPALADPPPTEADIGGLMRALRSCGCGEEGPESIVALVREALRQEPGPLVQAGPPLRFGPASGDGRERSVAASTTVERLLTSEELGDELLWIRAE